MPILHAPGEADALAGVPALCERMTRPHGYELNRNSMHVAVLHHVLLALRPGQSLLARGLPPSDPHEVVVRRPSPPG